MHTPGTSFADFTSALRRCLAVALLLAVVAPVAVYARSAQGKARYRASTDVILNDRLLVSAGVSSFGTDPGRVLQTQLTLSRSTRLVADVARRDVRGGESQAGFRARSGVELQPGTDILRFSVDDEDRGVAQRLADAYARRYADRREQLERDALTGILDDLRAQALRAPTTTAHRRLTEREVNLRAYLPVVKGTAELTPSDATPHKVAPAPLRNAILALGLGVVLSALLALVLAAWRRTPPSSPVVPTTARVSSNGEASQDAIAARDH